ncbi:MAG: hypothetical protein AB8G77_21805 [Rhodothermales bacterium]
MNRHLATDKRKPFASISSFLALFLIISAAYFSLTLQFDHWDGVIYDYAVITGDFAGVHEMHLQAGGFVQGTLFGAIDVLTSSFGWEIWQGYRALCLAIFGLSLFLTMRTLAEDTSPFPPLFLASALIPLAAIATSSMVATVYLFIGLGLIGAVIVSQRGLPAKIIGVLLVYFGMQVVHIAPALLGLCALLFVISRGRSFGGDLPWKSLIFQLLVLIAALLAAFFLGRLMFPSSVLYASYGDLNTPSVLDVVFEVIKQSIKIAMPLGIVTLLMFPAMAIAIHSSRAFVAIGARAAVIIIGLLFVAILNSVPFAMTGRSVPLILTITSSGAALEDFRYMILGFALAQIAFGLLLQYVVRYCGRALPIYFLACTPFFLGTLLFFWSWGEMRALDRSKAQIVSHWGAVLAAGDWTTSSACELPEDDPVSQASESSRYSFRPYDLNYLFFEASGQASHFVCSGACDAGDLLTLARTICVSPHAETTYLFSDTTCDNVIDQITNDVEGSRRVQVCY